MEYSVSTIESFIRMLKQETKDTEVINILKESEKTVKKQHPGWEQRRGNYFT
jgi:hypothetical protein